MTAHEMIQSGIAFQNLIYLPKVIPADYGGSLFYQFTMHLCDGTALTHSSCEVKGVEESKLYEAVLSLMREDVLPRAIRPRCDYLDIDKTLEYWKQTGQKNSVQYLVSACLAGEHCRYDGGSNRNPAVAKLVEDGLALPVCPEISGGLDTPRTPCELVGNRVISKDGTDCTEPFQAGALHVCRLAQRFGIKKAVLKQKSPSCGCGKVYDGHFCGRIIKGDGLAAAQLKENGIQVTTEEDFQ